MDVSNQIKAHGKVSRGWLGVGIQEVTKELADSFGLAKPSGALISAVEPGSPAEKAGLEASDVVLKYNGKAVNSSSELPRLVGVTQPGSKVMLQIWRKGATKDIALTVGELPSDKTAQRPAKGGKGTTNSVGLVLRELTPEQKQQLKVRNGVLVEDVEGAAARASIRRGDVIVAVNNNEVKNVEHLNQMLAQFAKGRNVALLVKRGDGAIYVPLKINGNN
jgi:serine protease Do